MPRIMLKGNADAQQTALLLKDTFTKAKNCDLIDSFDRSYGELFLSVMVFERYYTRVTNRCSLTLVVTGNLYSTIVDAIVTVAGTGSLMNFSWGTEDDFICNLQAILSEKGFSPTQNEQ